MRFESENKMETRVCNTCGAEKDINRFDKVVSNYKGNRKEYHIHKCRDCLKEKRNATNAKSRAKRREKHNAYQKEYYQNHKEQIKEYDKEYYKQNKSKIGARSAAYNKNKRKTDISYRIHTAISGMIWYSFKAEGLSKAGQSCAEYLPWTFEEVKVYIENLFESWMTWDNWGVYRADKWDDNDLTTWRWQIDHIIPRSHFEIISMDCQEFRNCWALSNLRPYSAKQNIIDGNRR